MIFVALGTQDKSFERLLKAIQKQITLGNIKEKVIVQAGYTKFNSPDMEIFDLVSMEDFNRYMDECDLLITHGGVGAITDGLRRGKKVIAAARLKEYGEHTNDHQLQIIEAFSNNGLILELKNFDDLDKVLNKAKSFKPKKFILNNENFVLKLKNYIDNN
jgi:UDP-N-acetylglucosamine transferase subunit ALG13